MAETRIEPVSATPHLESGIAATRAAMSGTINEIEGRLSPSHLREQIMEQLEQAKGSLKTQMHQEISELKGTVKHEVREIKETLKTELDDAKSAVRAATIGKVENMVKVATDAVNEARTSIVDTIRENPIPVALIGFGALWLVMNGRSSGAARRRMSGEAGAFDKAIGRVEDLTENAAIKVRDATGKAGHAVGNLAHEAADAAGELAHDAKDAAGNMAHRAQDVAGTVATKTKEGASNMGHRLVTTMHDNPLAVGAAVLALGTAVGLLIPRTNREDELMGAARDHLLEKAEQAARGAVDMAQKRASEALGDMQQHHA